MTWSNLTEEKISSSAAPVRDVAVDKFKRLGERLDFAEIALLELRVVKIIEVVKRPDAVAVAEEAFANVRADEARAAGDEKIHGQTLTITRAGCRACEGQTPNCEKWVLD